MSYSKLYRSTTSRVFGGVAGGIAEYFSMDPVIIRIIFVLAAIFGGGGVLIYLVLWIAVPERPFTSTMFNKENSTAHEANKENSPKTESIPDTEKEGRKYTGSMIGGIILIGIGALILASRVIPQVYFSDLWPFVLVVAGIILIVNSMTQPSGKEN